MNQQSLEVKIRYSYTIRPPHIVRVISNFALHRVHVRSQKAVLKELQLLLMALNLPKWLSLSD